MALNSASGASIAQLTKAGRIMLKRTLNGQVTIKVRAFQVGRGGYDTSSLATGSFLNPATVDGTLTELIDPVLTNLVTDGVFASGLASWTNLSSAPGTAVAATGTVTLTGNGAVGALSQSLVTVAGQWLLVAWSQTGSVKLESDTVQGGNTLANVYDAVTGTHYALVLPSSVQTFIKFSSTTTGTLTNVRAFHLTNYDTLESPNFSALSYLCRLADTDAQFGLGEWGIWAQVDYSTTVGEVGKAILFAVSHRGVLTKSTTKIANRYVVQL